MRKLLISTVVPLLWVAPAVAQVAQSAKPSAAQDDAITVLKPKSDQQQNAVQGSQSIEEQLRTRLAGAGFTDIDMAPLSFAVRAKDADGNPVLLLLSPDGVSEWQLSPQAGQDSSSLPGQESF